MARHRFGGWAATRLPLAGFRIPVQPNSAVRVQGHSGILKLTLGVGEYQHAFRDTQGRVCDGAAGKCH